MQTLLEAAHYQLNALLDRYNRVIDGLPEEALTWRPGDETTSSVAQLIRHVVAAMDAHLRLALGESGAYDREGALRNAPATVTELRDLLTTVRSQKERYLAQLAALDLDTVIEGGRRPLPRGVFVIHTIGHAYEHIGQAELTVQLWTQHNPQG